MTLNYSFEVYFLFRFDVINSSILEKIPLFMATFKRFEDIQIWQLARDLCKLVHKLTKRSPWNIDYKFKAQIESASGSVMDNIAEGFGRGEVCSIFSYLYF